MVLRLRMFFRRMSSIELKNGIIMSRDGKLLLFTSYAYKIWIGITSDGRAYMNIFRCLMNSVTSTTLHSSMDCFKEPFITALNDLPKMKWPRTLHVTFMADIYTLKITFAKIEINSSPNLGPKQFCGIENNRSSHASHKFPRLMPMYMFEKADILRYHAEI